ncbi:hypothetical protein [Spiroplasma culicicola]|uniref:Transmembrane protein n=1 Tax=Spiroplasma culicicola AES-1 TaxID=1276246 RepID=W6A6Y2_9MOLU|nr:hypothetical protein [Spiroplasma culicicola]AHI52742.1 hypothetical protein SCULI_v1c04010 [Spiroplasma culicicola AES-1]
MKKITLQIVFISIITFLYYFYNAWINSLDGNESLAFQIFDPFKLIILGTLFTIVYGTIKSMFFKKIININSYKKDLRNNLLFEFEITLNYLEKLQKSLKDQNINDLKALLKEFKTIKYCPVYLNSLIDELSSNILMEKDFSYLLGTTQLITKYIQDNFELEKQRIISTKQKVLFENKMTDNYYSLSSWQSIGYFLSIDEQKDINNKWKISSLYILRFSSSLFLAFSISFAVFAIIGLMSLLGVQIVIGKMFFIAFTLSVYLMSIILFVVNILANAKKNDLVIFWKHMSVFFVFITLIFLNIILNLVFFPEISNDQSVWYKQQLVQLLFSILYIILSSMLLLYIFDGFIQIVKTKKFNWLILIEAFILPLIIFTTSLVLNILWIKNGEDDKLYIVNFCLLFIFWSSTVLLSKFTRK